MHDIPDRFRKSYINLDETNIKGGTASYQKQLLPGLPDWKKVKVCYLDSKKAAVLDRVRLKPLKTIVL